MKQRFSSLDVRAISHELNYALVGTRIANVYDLVPPSATSPSSASFSRVIILRFSRSQEKYQLLVDSGFRCHLTAYDARASANASGPGGGGGGNAPSAFVSRLRNFLNGRLLASVAQLGTDRIIEFRFNDGQLRLYLEFFAAGNVVLTDATSKVLALQRTVAAFRSASLDVTLNVGNPYANGARQDAGVPELTLDRVREVLEKAVAADAPKAAAVGAGSSATPVKKKKNKGISRILGMHFTDLSQVLIDHTLLVAGLDTMNKVLPAEILADPGRLETLFQVLQSARTQAEALTKAVAKCPGYIIATRREAAETNAKTEVDETQGGGAADSTPVSAADTAAAPAQRESLDYIDFHPFLPRQFETDPKYVIVPFDSFNQAADEFYSHLQGRRADRQLHQQQSAAAKKLEDTKRDQSQRIESLQEAQQLSLRKAAAIEANQDWVQAAIDAVNDQLQAGMDWENLGVLIESSASSNPVAALFKLPMKLSEGIVTLRLDEEPEDGWEDTLDDTDSMYDGGDGGDDTEAPRKTIDVDIKLALSAWSNAREYYDQKRVAAVKELKTKEVTSLALRNAEKKVAKELQRVQKTGKPTPQLIRRPLWFEKYFWFVSSDGYLVLAARDPQQCEMLYRQHLRRGDVYVHADLRGSPGIIVIKNRPDAEPTAPIPPSTLAQAGTLAVCASEAWETKAGMGAYWVRADQVFKSTERGELLQPGNFDIRGDKNHMPPPQRVLGFGLYFKISDTSRGNHARPQDEEKGQGDEDGDDEGEQETSLGENNEAGNEAPEEETHKEETAIVAADSEPTEAAAETVDATFADQDDDQREAEAAAAAEGAVVEDEDEEKQEEDEEETVEEEESQGGSKPLVETNIAESSSPAPVRPGKGKGRLGVSSYAPSLPSTTNTASVVPSKRGQKAKAKKLAKYKDQDEEDRARAERLIGIAAGREKAEAKAKAKAQREAEMAAYEERRRVQKEKQMQKMRDYEAARQAQLEVQGKGGGDTEGGLLDGNNADGANGDNDAEGGGLDAMNALVGRPAPGDAILEVVPVCAPWMALSRLKYKVKVQPGPTKKGRAMRDVLERWRRAGEAGRSNSSIVDPASQDPERLWPREVELIAGIKMEEASNCVPVGKVTLMQGGGLGGASSGGKQSGKGSSGKGAGKSGKGGGKKR